MPSRCTKLSHRAVTICVSDHIVYNAVGSVKDFLGFCLENGDSVVALLFGPRLFPPAATQDCEACVRGRRSRDMPTIYAPFPYDARPNPIKSRGPLNRRSALAALTEGLSQRVRHCIYGAPDPS